MSLEVEKLQSLADEWGFDNPVDLGQSYIYEGTCPAVCMNPNCDATMELEHDAHDVYCTECGKETMNSMFIIMGVI